MDAQERARETARRLGWGDEFEKWEIDELVEQIRQAEQAARLDEREKALEEAAQVKLPHHQSENDYGQGFASGIGEMKRAIRALKDKP